MYSEKGLKHLVKYNSNLGSMLTQPYNSKYFNSNATESRFTQKKNATESIL